MCGIGGCINYNILNNTSLHSDILKTISHRGVDSQDFIYYKNILFAHTRLSIQDIQNGSQPFCIDGYILVFNGEIYNHLELRREYLSDIVFMTNSDSETLLYLYKTYKEKIFDLLDGMYSFAILDKKENNIIFAVDRAGKKPLYYYKKENLFFFASELNSISKNISLDIDEQEVNTYLKCGYFYKEKSIYKNTYRLNNGCFLKLDLSTMDIKIHKYFDMLDIYRQDDENMSFKEALSMTKEVLNKSVQNRLISSDLEVGAFLSGGIDSSLIVAMASSMTQKPLKTFTVSFDDDSSFDESYLASLVAKRYNTNHTKISINIDNLSNDIDTILASFGEPFFDSSAIPSFYVAKRAKEYVNVVLNGDGADELFGGYRRYVAGKYNKYFRLFNNIYPFLKAPQNKQSLYSHLYRALNLSVKKNLSFYLSATTDIFEDLIDFDNKSIRDFDKKIKYINTLDIDDVSKMMYLDFDNLLFSDLLKKIDITSMYFSLEARSAFLSKDMIELAGKIPAKYKIHNFSTKYILRELAKQYIPQELINQPKRGFEIPLVKWVENDLKTNIFDSLENGYHKNFIDNKFILDLQNDKLNISKQKKANILWSIFALNTWHKNQI
jgi:asparagine synthase (glutamine-hydrolysing)